MPLNLTKPGKKSLLDTEVNPREIFNLLPDKEERYKYPRDVQTQVWDKWLARRTDRDLVVKMNTGGGKTVVGLLMLKSCLNEGIGPAVYVAPDNYLVGQVMKEAADLGIEVTADPTAGAFLSGKAILIANIYKLINGLSVFGTSDTGVKIRLGVVLVDDAHACLTTTEAQFTLTVSAGHPVYDALLQLFEDELLEQNDTKLLEIKAGAGDQEMLVPFWAWDAKGQQVARVLAEHRGDDDIKFRLPLIKHHLSLCRCVVSGRKLEVAPRCLPIEAIPSFTEANRRIFMTATLADDSILVSDFGANPDLVLKHITPNVANDIGDRMILVPQEIDPAITDDALKTFVKERSKDYNTVVIVPSDFRATFWADVADMVVKAENLQEAVDRLKTEHVGLVVLVNKYDGIDLPNEACRILVLDGLPQARRLYERVETNFLAGSEEAIGRQMQRIEQGMGRGIRANDDYCVVLLMGASLTRTMFTMGAKQMLSPATRAQLENSLTLAADLGSGLPELNSAIQVCLIQGSEWKRVAREAVANIAYPTDGSIRATAVAQRAAFDNASIRNYAQAEAALQDVINEEAANASPVVIGWLKWQLAEYVQLTDAVRAQQILKAALQSNRRLTRPIDGLEYERLDARDMQQAKNVVWMLKSCSGKKTELLVRLNGILDDLMFLPDNANQFEAAMDDLAAFIGFRSQRPELEFKRGPDVLWAVGNQRYFVIECKSGAVAPTIGKHYVNQLSGSMNWFAERYDHTSKATPIMVHPSSVLEAAATAQPEARIMTAKRLAMFKDVVRDFCTAASASLEPSTPPKHSSCWSITSSHLRCCSRHTRNHRNRGDRYDTASDFPPVERYAAQSDRTIGPLLADGSN